MPGASARVERCCPVSYTHLDVYKRQVYFSWLVGSGDDSPQLRATWMILLAELVLSVGLLAAIVVLSLIHI